MYLPVQAPPVARSGTAAGPASGVNPSDVCISVSYNNGQICGNFPILGQQCISIPFLPSGSGTAQACVSYQFPDCANICVSVNGSQLGCITQCL